MRLGTGLKGAADMCPIRVQLFGTPAVYEDGAKVFFRTARRKPCFII